jgi:hypothetical protein
VKHLSTKVILQMGRLYIKCPRSQAWHEPSIDISRLLLKRNVEALVFSEKPRIVHDVWDADFSSAEACSTQ